MLSVYAYKRHDDDCPTTPSFSTHARPNCCASCQCPGIKSVGKFPQPLMAGQLNSYTSMQDHAATARHAGTMTPIAMLGHPHSQPRQKSRLHEVKQCSSIFRQDSRRGCHVSRLRSRSRCCRAIRPPLLRVKSLVVECLSFKVMLIMVMHRVALHHNWKKTSRVTRGRPPRLSLWSTSHRWNTDPLRGSVPPVSTILHRNHPMWQSTAFTALGSFLLFTHLTKESGSGPSGSGRFRRCGGGPGGGLGRWCSMPACWLIWTATKTPRIHSSEILQLSHSCCEASWQAVEAGWSWCPPCGCQAWILPPVCEPRPAR